VQTTVVNTSRRKPALNRNQIRGFWASWGGWMMDGMDSFITLASAFAANVLTINGWRD